MSPKEESPGVNLIIQSQFSLWKGVMADSCLLSAVKVHKDGRRYMWKINDTKSVTLEPPVTQKMDWDHKTYKHLKLRSLALADKY